MHLVRMHDHAHVHFIIWKGVNVSYSMNHRTQEATAIRKISISAGAEHKIKITIDQTYNMYTYLIRTFLV